MKYGFELNLIIEASSAEEATEKVEALAKQEGVSDIEIEDLEEISEEIPEEEDET